MKRRTLDLRTGPDDRRYDSDGETRAERWAIRFGLPALLAAFLVWYITLGPGNNRVSAEPLGRMETLLNRHVNEMIEDSKGRVLHELRMENYARQTCENVAFSIARIERQAAAILACRSVR